MMNTLLIGAVIVGGFAIWKFGIEPIMNEGKPIEPPKDYKTFGEKMDEAMQINIDDVEINTKVDF